MAETPAERLARLRGLLAEAAAKAAAAHEEPAEDASEEPERTARFRSPSFEPTFANPSSAPSAAADPTIAPPLLAAPAAAPPAPAPEAPAPEAPAPAAPAPDPPSAPPPAPPTSPPAPPTSPPTWQPSPPEAPRYPAPPSAPSWQPGAAPPPPPAGRGAGGLRTAGIIGAVVVITALLLVGIGIALGRTFQEGGVKYSDLKAGDCFQQPSGRFNKVKTVPCTADHDLEVYAVLDHPAAPKAPFPGMDALVRYANPLCLAQFKTYAGVAFEQVNLKDVYITPRESAWKDGARRLVCAVGAGNDQPTKQSVKAGAK